MSAEILLIGSKVPFFMPETKIVENMFLLLKTQ